jgi:hypothetical protein
MWGDRAAADAAPSHRAALQAMGLGAGRNRAIGREQNKLGVPAGRFIKGFDLAAPSLILAVVDLAEIQHLALNHFAAGTALVLDNIPIAMLLAVLKRRLNRKNMTSLFSWILFGAS